MTRISKQQLDRLVDGELGERDRRDLLESLEQCPGGWRQCACAFLEAQEFNNALSDFVVASDFVAADAQDAEPQDAVPQDATDRRGSVFRDDSDTRLASEFPREQPGNIRWWAALAACLVIGVGIGQLGPSQLRPSQLRPSQLRPGHSGLGVVRDLGASISTSSTETPPSLDNQNEMVASANPNHEPVGLSSDDSALPNDIEDILGRLGQRVERRRVYTAEDALSGRPISPIEEIEIVPVRWDTY